MYVYTYIYLYVCMCTYVQTYQDTHISTYTQRHTHNHRRPHVASLLCEYSFLRDMTHSFVYTHTDEAVRLVLGFTRCAIVCTFIHV